MVKTLGFIFSDVNQQVTHHAPLRRMPSFNPNNPPTSLPPSTASVSDWLKSNDAHLIQGPGRPRSGLSEHPPLSPQSSTASSGSGSDTHVEDVQHHSVRNTFMEEGSGMRGESIIWAATRENLSSGSSRITKVQTSLRIRAV